MKPMRECGACGAKTATDPADACPVCGEIDWSAPRSAEPIDRDDEEVVENAHAVETPGS